LELDCTGLEQNGAKRGALLSQSECLIIPEGAADNVPLALTIVHDIIDEAAIQWKTPSVSTIMRIF
jgi:hypothetical protein